MTTGHRLTRHQRHPWQKAGDLAATAVLRNGGGAARSLPGCGFRHWQPRPYVGESALFYVVVGRWSSGPHPEGQRARPRRNLCRGLKTCSHCKHDADKDDRGLRNMCSSWRADWKSSCHSW
ncbi:unnamed protein product [Cladocopium goreaui]|uniref:Uncharacterized protein n=1 Tax=Cladocopium goreaui TaxID=2562237 RepID=A0A9P1GN32_9DINO|nr:unnamed protein product [Cladocopium goreaui]